MIILECQGAGYISFDGHCEIQTLGLAVARRTLAATRSIKGLNPSMGTSIETNGKPKHRQLGEAILRFLNPFFGFNGDEFTYVSGLSFSALSTPILEPKWRDESDFFPLALSSPSGPCCSPCARYLTGPAAVVPVACDRAAVASRGSLARTASASPRTPARRASGRSKACKPLLSLDIRWVWTTSNRGLAHGGGQ
ncbi:hypothetical protein VTG60DRAFT_5300 [Thermothelomyces hinnuleus]